MNGFTLQPACKRFAAGRSFRLVVGVRECGERIDQHEDVHTHFRITLCAFQQEIRRKYVRLRLVVECGIDEICSRHNLFEFADGFWRLVGKQNQQTKVGMSLGCGFSDLF